MLFTIAPHGKWKRDLNSVTLLHNSVTNRIQNMPVAISIRTGISRPPLKNG
jgi:hypothetical protein